MAASDRSPFANEQEELAFLRQRMQIFDEYQKSAYAAHAKEMKEDKQPPFKGITGYGKRTAALIMMERDELARQVDYYEQSLRAIKLITEDWLTRAPGVWPDAETAAKIIRVCMGEEVDF
jgi:hypothetical protein